MCDTCDFERSISWWRFTLMATVTLVSVFSLYYLWYNGFSIWGKSIVCLILCFLLYRWANYFSFRCRLCGARGIKVIQYGFSVYWVCPNEYCTGEEVCTGAAWYR